MVAVQSLLTSLTAKRLVKDFPATAKTDADLGFDKPTAVVSLWTDGVKKDEKPAEEAKKEDDKDAAKKDEARKDGDKKEAEKDAKKPASQQPALKDPKPTIKLTFGKRDKDLVYVKREAGSDVARMAVPASVLDRASEGKLAYFDKRFPVKQYPEDAVKVVLESAMAQPWKCLARTPRERKRPPEVVVCPRTWRGEPQKTSKMEMYSTTSLPTWWRPS